MILGNVSQQIYDAVAVTTSDTNNLPGPSAAAIAKLGSPPKMLGLYTGAGGDITADLESGATAVLFKSTPAGAVILGSFVRVRATGTAATNILALYFVP